MKTSFTLLLILYAIRSFSLCSLPAPKGLKPNNIARCQVTLKWKPVNGAVNYNVQYKQSSASNWTILNNIGNIASYTVGGLNASTAYNFKIAAVCANGEEGNYTTPVNATTVSCSAPVNVTATGLTAVSAIINWSVPCGESNFKLSYKKSGSSTWNIISGISTTNYLLTNLDPETSYDVKLKSKCGAPSSAYSTIVSFTTLAASAPLSSKNVLLIIVDDARFDTYNATAPVAFFQDSNISRIAYEGVNFQQSFSVQSQCAPSRGSIVTGLYPHIHGVIDNPPTSIADTITEITLPQILHDNGYYTGLIGKYHISKHPQPGYDYWLECHNNDYTDTKFNYNGVNKTINGHRTDIVADSAVAFFHKVPEGKPFYLWLAYNAPHTPLDPRPEDEGLFDDDTMPWPDNFEKYTENFPAFLYNCHSGDDSITLVNFYRDYFEMLNGVEETLGDVFNEMESLGLMDSTLIIFMSDNGYMIGEHKMLEKQLAYDPSMRIPLFIRYPKLIPPGKLVKKEVALNIDIAPTILDFAGIDDTFGMQGVSLLKLMKKEVTRDEMLYEFYDQECVPDIRAVRSLNFKYVQYNCSDITEELFDLQNDSEENINLVNNPAYAVVLQEYRDKLDYWRNYYADYTWDSLYECSLANPQRLTIEETDEISLLNVFPNPSTGSMVLHFISSEGAPSIIRIINSTGNTVQEMILNDSSTEFSQPISLNNFSAGSYVAIVQHGDKTHSKPFIIE